MVGLCAFEYRPRVLGFSKTFPIINAGENLLACRERMMREIKESDWKLLKQIHSQALERFCKQVLLEIECINCDTAKGFHQKYLDIYEVLHRHDKQMARIFDDLRRSTALIHLASMKARGLLTDDEFSRFSEESRNLVDQLLGSRPNASDFVEQHDAKQDRKGIRRTTR